MSEGMSEETRETPQGLRPWLSAHRRGLLVSAGLLLLLAVLLLANHARGYTDYSVRASAELTDAAATRYAGLGGNLLKYSADGAFCTDLAGALLWNDTYEMSNPAADQSGDYLILYDERGTQVRLLNPAGRVAALQMSLPIVTARVSANGMTAVLMQDGDTGYIRLYSADSNLYASGEVHLENSGYPIAMALGPEGQTLVLSLLDINGGDVKTTLLFYNFGRAGADQEDHIVGRFSYANMVIPQLEYLDQERLLAIGDNELILFGSRGTPEAETQVFPSERLRRVFCGGSAFGFVTGGTEEDGTSVSHIAVYGANGSKKYETDVTDAFDEIRMLSNGETALLQEEKLILLSAAGERKFVCAFDSAVRQIIPQEGSREYVIVRDGALEQIRLR